jgi:hypothetical protein
VAVTAPVGAAPAPEPVVALDVASHAAAVALVDRLGPACGFYKIGLELFTAAGPAVVEALRARGLDVFLDLKLHDIPNTVAGAARSAARLGVRLLTVHASGGADMVRAAVDGFGPRSDGGVLAVTVLTSLDAAAVAAAWGRRRSSWPRRCCAWPTWPRARARTAWCARATRPRPCGIATPGDSPRSSRGCASRATGRGISGGW